MSTTRTLGLLPRGIQVWMSSDIRKSHWKQEIVDTIHFTNHSSLSLTQAQHNIMTFSIMGPEVKREEDLNYADLQLIESSRSIGRLRSFYKQAVAIICKQTHQLNLAFVVDLNLGKNG